MVASIMAYSLSGSSAVALKRLRQTPLTAQREKRVWMFFQARTAPACHAKERPSGISRSQPRRTADCLDRNCGQRIQDDLAAFLRSARTGRRAIRGDSSGSLIERLPMNHAFAAAGIRWTE